MRLIRTPFMERVRRAVLSALVDVIIPYPTMHAWHCLGSSDYSFSFYKDPER